VERRQRKQQLGAHEQLSTSSGRASPRTQGQSATSRSQPWVMDGGASIPPGGRPPSERFKTGILRPHLIHGQFGLLGHRACFAQDGSAVAGSWAATGGRLLPLRSPRCHGNASPASATIASKGVEPPEDGRGSFTANCQSTAGVSAANDPRADGPPAGPGMNHLQAPAVGTPVANSTIASACGGPRATRTSTAIPKRSRIWTAGAMVGRSESLPFHHRDLTGARFRCWPEVWGDGRRQASTSKEEAAKMAFSAVHGAAAALCRRRSGHIAAGSATSASRRRLQRGQTTDQALADRCR